jgi:hypothetical protein
LNVTVAPFDQRVFPRHSQGASSVRVDGHDANWSLFAHRDGTIAVRYGGDPQDAHLIDLIEPGRGEIDAESGVREREGQIAAGWRLAADLLRKLGCSGEARFFLVVNSALPTLRGVEHHIQIEHATDVRAPRSDEFEGVMRELKRATGEITPEPEPEQAAEQS